MNEFNEQIEEIYLRHEQKLTQREEENRELKSAIQQFNSEFQQYKIQNEEEKRLQNEKFKQFKIQNAAEKRLQREEFQQYKIQHEEEIKEMKDKIENQTKLLLRLKKKILVLRGKMRKLESDGIQKRKEIKRQCVECEKYTDTLRSSGENIV